MNSLYAVVNDRLLAEAPDTQDSSQDAGNDLNALINYTDLENVDEFFRDINSIIDPELFDRNTPINQMEYIADLLRRDPKKGLQL